MSTTLQEFEPQYSNKISERINITRAKKKNVIQDRHYPTQFIYKGVKREKSTDVKTLRKNKHNNRLAFKTLPYVSTYSTRNKAAFNTIVQNLMLHKGNLKQPKT